MLRVVPEVRWIRCAAYEENWINSVNPGGGFRAGQFPVAERLCRENLSIPVFPELTQDERAYVAESIRAFYGG